MKSKNLTNITLCNRTLERAKAVAEVHSLSILERSQMKDWHHYDWIIVGTKASDYIITRPHFPMTCKSRKLLIDLCVPRNVEPRLARDPCISLLNIDQINRILRVRKQQMTQVLSKAEHLVASATKNHLALFKEKESYQHQLHVIGA